MNVSRLLGGAAIAVLATTLAAGAAQAQDNAATVETPATEEQRANEILVTGQIFFRNRTADPNPVLSYDLEYFQKFEPVSVGEMLKRVPGATFTSDVLEYDQVQFRGLPGGFTNVLINGRRAPGGESDGTFFVDRIPAELVERIEIVRAPRPDQPSDGVAGTLNVITKESASFEGGFGKIGALLNTRDGVFRPSAAAAFAGKIGEKTDYWIALNYQKRRNPKSKVSYRFDDVPVTDDKRFPGDPSKSNYVTDPEFHDFEAQSDTRDGSDLSGSAEITTRFGDGGRLRLNGFFVDTHRDEDEQSVTLDDASLDFDGVELQKERIKQQTYAITADARVPLSDSFELGLAGGWNQYRENTRTSVFEGDNENDYSDVDLDEEETLHIKDSEWSGTLFGNYEAGAFKLKIGSDFLFKTRDGLNDGVLTDIFRIRENRYSPYARLTYDLGSSLTIDGGARYEIVDRKVTATTASAKYNTGILNPSLSLRWSPTGADQFRASVARTIRRPDYDLLSPIEYDETPGDDDTTTGNPDLRNQSAWGVDVGYERRIGGSGIAGVNFFYRDITDLIELVATRDNGAGQDFRPQNIGDGQAWGVEFDLSAPLTFLGMPDTGVFANYTYLDSSTTDPFTGEKRRFNAQPHHVYNVGFIQTVKAADVSFGATISGRSKSLESNFDETVELRYDPDLEAFVEKRIGKHIVLRVSAQNLLDRVKYEEFRKYDGDSLEEILQNRAAGDLDEYEIEREHSGPLVQFTIRAAF
ncbi:outer membrane receptor protein involved in Fe transport [Sphingomonas kyeonggiensis]|uniref:TonB-dependent receptor plug domain-containing protein n=1 Tax=Sphingomonas kyeonggiensis TaxID=1268553 RepID=UPI002784C279|nr:TonB-dependent receptor [Sphingomonas kyeonggiensis]MDQ0252199.1 outer membrane receptor protein involved in Fe transport [Sphingomonas kyeonggiensis]